MSHANIRALFRFAIVLLCIFSLMVPVAASTAEPDYVVLGQFDCYVKTELKDIQYTVCCADVIDRMGLAANFPVAGTDTSVEDIAGWFDTEGEFPWQKMYDLDTKTDLYPLSFREAMSRYNDAFFAESFLMVALAPSIENSTVTPLRLDVVDYAGSEKLLMIFDIPESHECEWSYETAHMYFVIAEVPLEYYHEYIDIRAVTAHYVDGLEESPKTADSFAFLPAAAAMVLAGLGLAWARRRRVK